MEIYLVRHTETVCGLGVCYGQTDVKLKEPYLEQFSAIKKDLPQNAICYSSPSQRCLLLAEYLADNHVTVDNRLMEMNFGAWELVKWDAIPEEELNPWMNDFVNEKVPQGESFIDLYKRIEDFIENLLLQKNENPIVIVTHAGVIRSLLCKFSDLPLKDAFKNKVAFGEVLKIAIPT